MTQLTLESLAERVAVLEHKVAELTRTRSLLRTGTGDWDAAAKAAAEIRASNGFDFDALRDQDACDLRHANDHLL
ncbi:MAG: hypothetical protein L0241_21375 [Planctomycetia bacterium]|nr:hypothetical protein [Planctomycetia bacterium]